MIKPTWIEVPMPPMGGKIWLLEEKGMYVLERGPGALRTDACTHAGSGVVEFIDGVPDENGYFPDEHLSEPEQFTPDEYRRVMDCLEHKTTPDEDIQVKISAMKAWGSRNGRTFYKACPAVMGSWMLDGGFHHGLTVRATGDRHVNTIASIVWVPYVSRKHKSE